MQIIIAVDNHSHLSVRAETHKWVGVKPMNMNLSSRGGLLLRTVSIAALLAVLPGAGFAEEQKVASIQHTDETGVPLDRISVEGTRFPIAAFDVPASVSVINRQEIEDLNPSSLSDIFERIPGAQFDGGPRRSGQTPSVRGLGGSGVLITLDGARQSFVSGHDGRIFVDPEILSAVEVIRGPASALHGSGAVGGVIALRTLDAADIVGAGESAVLSLKGGFDTVKDERHVTGTAAYQTPDQKFGVVASGTFRSSDDIRLGSGFDLPADDKVVSMLLKGTGQVTDALKITADWIRYRLDTTDPANPQQNNMADPSNPLVDRKVSSDTGILRADLNPAGNDWINGHVAVFGALTEVEEDEVANTDAVTRKVRSIGFSGVNNAEVTDWLTLTFGAEAHHDKQTGTDNTSADGSRGGVPDASAQFYGAFVQGEFRIEDVLPGTLAFLPGVRIDRFISDADGQDKTRDIAVSPKLGVRYTPNDWLMLFGNVAKAFRAPSFNEIYADGTHFTIPLGYTTIVNAFQINPDLEPERSLAFELGGGIDFANVVQGKDRIAMKASYWHAKVDNLINLYVQLDSTCFIPGFPCTSANSFSQYVNTDATLDGVEVELNYDSPNIYAHVTFSAINGDEDYPVASEPVGIAALYPNKVRIDLGAYLVESRALKFGTRMTFADDFTEGATSAEDRDGYSVFDLYAVYEPVSGILNGLRIDLAVENIADKDYEVVFAGTSEEGRNFKAAVRYRLPL